MLSRREFVKIAAKTGLASASAPLWLHETSKRAFAQLSSTYKAIVVISLEGGNDSNNMLIPLDNGKYNEYAALRPLIALSQSACLPLTASGTGGTYGFHPALRNISQLFNNGNALVVANVGPLKSPATKSQLTLSPSLIPEELLSHPAGSSQWESASTVAYPSTGWGGRIADLIASQSGSLPPVLSAGVNSIFGVGHSVQGIVVSNAGSLTALPAGMDAAILAIANDDVSSSNSLVAQAANVRIQATQQQVLISNALSAGSPLKTQFATTQFGQVMKTIAGVLNGRSVIGASRQIFYCQQGVYDTHIQQISMQNSYLSELDAGIGAFSGALQEMGLQNDVLICTHSDFNRTLLGNGSGGTDHAWGSHQLVIGGGIRGGRIIGNVPDPELGGSLDLNGYGTWIPSLSATQMTAGIGAWMGLSNNQLTTVFPDLGNFTDGPVLLT
jgi:uncharacterized protein (DUF1501 family)